jgi:hypothetical protein
MFCGNFILSFCKLGKRGLCFVLFQGKQITTCYYASMICIRKATGLRILVVLSAILIEFSSSFPLDLSGVCLNELLFFEKYHYLAINSQALALSKLFFKKNPLVVSVVRHNSYC